MKSKTLQLVVLSLFATLGVCIPNSAFAQTTIYRPTTYSYCNPVGYCYVNPTSAFDGVSATSSSASVYGGPLGGYGNYALRHWYGFSSATGTPTSIKLKITSSVTGSGGSAAQINLSLDGGAHLLAPIYLTNSRTQKTDDITLPVTQDITQVQVWAQAYGAPASGIVHYINEIWIEVTQ